MKTNEVVKIEVMLEPEEIESLEKAREVLKDIHWTMHNHDASISFCFDKDGEIINYSICEILDLIDNLGVIKEIFEMGK